MLEAKGTPQRRIRKVLSEGTSLAPFDIDGKVPISLGLTCCCKQMALQMPSMQAGRGRSREGELIARIP